MLTDTPAIPEVHMNGTSKKELIDQQLAVYRAAQALQDALAKATPHMRDYYVTLNGDPYTTAQRQHTYIRAMVAEIAARAEKIMDSIDTNTP